VRIGRRRAAAERRWQGWGEGGGAR
jgi:hypothetical protein